jgi:hypothetical protein
MCNKLQSKGDGLVVTNVVVVSSIMCNKLQSKGDGLVVTNVFFTSVWKLC